MDADAERALGRDDFERLTRDSVYLEVFLLPNSDTARNHICKIRCMRGESRAPQTQLRRLAFLYRPQQFYLIPESLEE